MSRRRWIVLGIVVFVVALLGIGTLLAFRDSATPVDAQELIDSGEGAVFVYETTGFEEVSALGGRRHDYPAESFITVEAADCGVAMRWQVLEERWAEWRFCDGSVTPITYDVFNQWFGRKELGQFTCTEPAAAGLEPGTSWEIECISSSTDTTEVFRYLVEGTETLTVDGEDVETVHLRMMSDTTGRTTGGMTVDEWRLADGGWPIVKRIAIDDSVTSSPIGPVTYHEEYTIVLRSLEPTGG
jgi:hypothetical protein